MGVPAISRPVLGFFRRIVRGYFRRHFHAVRVSGAERFVAAGAEGAGAQGAGAGETRPLLVYANHGSWWDPMVAIVLAEELMPGRRHYAPMDAAALERYGILKRVGIFPVEAKTARGAVQFLRTGETVLLGGGVLWVTPEGRFVDARVRPLEFKPGLAALAARVGTSAGSCTVLPLAIEYSFWDERLPECLLRFGEPVRVAAGEDAKAVQGRLVEALELTLDELREMAVGRNGAAFETLARGAEGVGGFYALGQRVKALVLRRFRRGAGTASNDGAAGKIGGDNA